MLCLKLPYDNAFFEFLKKRNYYLRLRHFVTKPCREIKSRTSIYFYYFMFRSSPVKSHLHRDHATVAIAPQDKASEQFMNLVLHPSWRQRSLMLTLDPQNCKSNPLRPTSLMNVSFISKVSSHSQTYYLFKNNCKILTKIAQEKLKDSV